MRSAPIVAVIALTAANAGASTYHPPRSELEVISPGHATLTLEVRSRSVDGVEVSLPVELPVGMTATGLSVALGDGVPLHSRALDIVTARSAYDEVVASIKDPALLVSRGGRRALLRVFPVRRDAPARVVIELTATSLVEANHQHHLDATTALLAAPGAWLRDGADDTQVAVVEDPWNNYWPEHRDEL